MKVKLVSYSTPTEEFLNEGIAETRRKIKEGIYILKDLNKPSYKL